MNLEGKKIGKYHVRQLIGDGAMGRVYEVVSDDSNQPVAMKIMNTELAEDEVFRGRFEREMNVMASLSHPHIIPVLDHGSADGYLYLIMKLIHGESLGEIMRRRQFSPLATWNILKSLVSALDFGHQKGVLHRDIKPGNVLLERTNDGSHIYLMDFGLAKVPGIGMTITETGISIGTPEYMSPEAAMGKEIDNRSDIYSLAITVYELLLGIVPFDEGVAHLTAIAQVNDPPTPPIFHRPDFPRGISDVIIKSLAKKPDQRHQSVAEFADDYYNALSILPPEVQRREFSVL